MKKKMRIFYTFLEANEVQETVYKLLPVKRTREERELEKKENQRIKSTLFIIGSLYMSFLTWNWQEEATYNHLKKITLRNQTWVKYTCIENNFKYKRALPLRKNLLLIVFSTHTFESGILSSKWFVANCTYSLSLL